MNFANRLGAQKTTSAQKSARQRSSRRRLLMGGGALLGTAALTAGSQASARAHYGDYLTLDIAQDGRTFRLNRMDPTITDQLPVRGDTFIVSGPIYPGGTIETGLTGPDQAGNIGTWICKGWFHVEDITQTPYVATTQYFLLDDGSALITEGLEGGTTNRAIIGGIGRWGDVIGDVLEEPVEENDTVIPLGPADDPASNIRFVFRMTPRSRDNRDA